MKENPNKDINLALTIAKNSKRYKNFIFFDKPEDKPVSFATLMKDEDIDYVQIHSLQAYENNGYKDIIGFSGIFEWKNNILKPLDGDTYNPKCLVYGYQWFKTKDNKRGLDILVGEDW